MIIWLLACAHPVTPQLSIVPTDPPTPVTALVMEITNIGRRWGQCHIASAVLKPEGWDRYRGPYGTEIPWMGPGETGKIQVLADWPIYEGDDQLVCLYLVCEGDGGERGWFNSEACYANLPRTGVIQCEYDGYALHASCDNAGLTVFYP